MRARRFCILLCALGLALGTAACGQEAHPREAGSNNNGEYVDAGPITYQLEVSRALSQYSTEDSQYLAGLPAGANALSSDQLWFGVFLWAKNQSSQPQTTSDQFDIVDTQGNKYYPVALDPRLNAYAWTRQTLTASGTEPLPGSTAADGPTQGGLLLFKLPNQVYSNRPLTLEIYAAGQSEPSTISLDL